MRSLGSVAVVVDPESPRSATAPGTALVPASESSNLRIETPVGVGVPGVNVAVRVGVFVGVGVPGVNVAVRVGVFVVVLVGVLVGVAVPGNGLVEVRVGVLVGRLVAVFVGVRVGVTVGVLVGVLVALIGERLWPGRTGASTKSASNAARPGGATVHAFVGSLFG